MNENKQLIQHVFADRARRGCVGRAGVKIGELSARSGRGIHAIRWYEAQGLIPGVARDSGGRRVYSDLHVAWLDFMHRLRRTGMTIAQMREYTALVRKGSSTLRERRALLTRIERV